MFPFQLNDDEDVSESIRGWATLGITVINSILATNWVSSGMNKLFFFDCYCQCFYCNRCIKKNKKPPTDELQEVDDEAIKLQAEVGETS